MNDKPSPSPVPAAPQADAAPNAGPSERQDEHANPDDLRLQRQVLRAIENAGIHGLCREGQQDIAVDMVKTQRPEWEDGTVLAFVRHVMVRRT